MSGPALRLLRERAGVGLRAVARGGRNRMSLSDSHLSRVERGLRTVTPAIVAAYERALGMRIDAESIAAALPDGAPDQVARREFNTTLGAIILGSPPPAADHHRALRDIDELLRPPAHVGHSDVTHLRQAAALVRDLDLRHGGALTCQIAIRLLRWGLPMRTAAMTAPVRTGLHTAIGTLATFAAWAAFDAAQHHTARHLFTLALDAAVVADDPDLRAHILADVAAVHNHLDHPGDALQIIRLAGGDERVSPAIRSILHGVHANTHAAQGHHEHTTREIDHAEHAAAAVTPDAVPAWLGGWHPAHTSAVCAHAAATLAVTTSTDTDLADAHKRLTHAIDTIDATARTRALARCQTRLALLHLHNGDTDEATHWAHQARTQATDLHSARVDHDLATIHTDTGTPP